MSKCNISLGQNLWVYGSGSFAAWMISELESLGHIVLGVLDHKNIGKEIGTQKTFYRVENVSNVEMSSGSQVVLGVCNLHGDLKEIASSFSGDIQVLTPVSLFRFFAENGIALSNYWLTTNFELYSASLSEIEKFRGILSDDLSRQLLNSILSYRQFGDIADLPNPRPLSEQYLAKDLSTPPTELKIIDLGACQGENLSDFLDAGHRFTSGYLLEPDDNNLKVLESKLANLGITTLSSHKLGAWDETTTLRFDASGNTGAALSKDGSNMIDVVALDDFIPKDFKPNFVKMDIEGAELEALKGMVGLIQQYTPHLAISVYHKPSDLWVLGNFLSDKFPGRYEYFLRVYGHQTFDTLLYAIPKI